MKPLAIITGASRGIGQAAAYYFARKGYNLILLARSEQALALHSKTLEQQFDIKAEYHSLDVSDRQAVFSLMDDVLLRHDRIDVLFNNAGVLHRGGSAIEPEAFDEMLNVNLRALYNMIYCCVPRMKAQQSGYIFNLASYAGQRPLPQSAAYCMSKYGAVGFSKSLSLELAPDNIKVTALCPSVVDTQMTAGFADFPNEEKIRPEDLALTLDYLLNLSPQAYVDEVIIKSTFMLKNKVY